MSKSLLLHAWALEKKNGQYYLPFSHWAYLNQIIKYYDEVVLLSVCKQLDFDENETGIEISQLGESEISVYELPFSNGYVGSIQHFFSYVKGYWLTRNVDEYYARYPAPFGWLQKVFGKNKKRIIHFVGDPVDAAKKNPNFSKIKKTVLVKGFYFENFLYKWACKGAAVYTNGNHLSEKLGRKEIKATPLISSTLTSDDFYFKDKNILPNKAKFVYLGYLRTAKGIETIVRAFALFNNKNPGSSLTIIGTGEIESWLKRVVKEVNIENVRFLGHIEERKKINEELRSADIFLFGSLSEGSPRVILEAMANGLAVISTPVGSLPDIFEDKKNICFAEFNDPNSFYENMISLSQDSESYNKIRADAYRKSKNFTLDKFIKRIFYE
ncbi:glycosyltransferase family 4 protein [uncultured Halomonas sp.]|uniref:glycosyltransferase family 4 protein n=1 Tax=uncultured Halomonas sp. TaxID=173971 RepID=UPI00260E11F5|nr:glycosyltransferase family 4 protein [uncultured Halomonas sp.]